MLGRLDPDGGLAGGVALDRAAAEAAIAALAEELGLEPLAAAEGIVEVADQEMIRALRVVTVERGVDPRGFALMPFGGAGPLHAAAIADELGIDRILCPRSGGVLSALGLVCSERRRDTTRTVMLSGEELTARGSPRRWRRRLPHSAPAPDADARGGLRHAVSRSVVRAAGRRPAWPPTRAGWPRTSRPSTSAATATGRTAASVELVDIRLAAREPVAEVELRGRPEADPRRGRRRARIGGEWLELEAIAGEPPVGFTAEGPCVFDLPETTLLLPAGWRATVDRCGTIVAERVGRPGGAAS